MKEEVEASLISELEKLCIEAYRNESYDEKLKLLIKCNLKAEELSELQKDRHFDFTEPTRKENQKNLKQLQEWLENNGVDMSKVQVCESKKFNCNGVRCRTTINEAEVAFEIPESLFISVAKFLSESSFWRKMCQDQRIVAPQTVLSLALLKEKIKGKGSFYAPYLSILPRNFSFLPIFWPNDKLKYLLKTSSVITYKRKLEFYMHYCELYTFFRKLRMELNASKLQYLPRKFEFFTLKNFLWAIAVTTTRQNNIKIPTDASTVFRTMKNFGLVPLLDMCNHEDGIISSGCDEDNRSVTAFCRAQRSFHEGEEFMIHYGDRSSSDLLVYSGFVPLFNKSDRVAIDVLQDFKDKKLSYNAELIDPNLEKLRQIFLSKLTKQNSRLNLMLGDFEGMPQLLEKQILPLSSFLLKLYVTKDIGGLLLRASQPQQQPHLSEELIRVQKERIPVKVVLDFILRNATRVLEEHIALRSERRETEEDSSELQSVLSLLNNQILLLKKCIKSLKDFVSALKDVKQS